jgi:hypothetical protein
MSTPRRSKAGERRETLCKSAFTVVSGAYGQSLRLASLHTLLFHCRRWEGNLVTVFCGFSPCLGAQGRWPCPGMAERGPQKPENVKREFLQHARRQKTLRYFVGRGSPEGAGGAEFFR